MPHVRPQSLRFVRRVAIFGAVAMLLSALLVAPVRYHQQSEDIRRTAEIYNESLAHSLALLVRDRVHSLLLSHDHVPDPIGGRGIQATLDNAFAELAQYSKLLKVKLFDRDGNLIYSTDAAEEGEEGDAEDEAFDRAFKDKVTSSDMTFRPNMTTLNGLSEDRYVVASYVPIFNDTTRRDFLGLFEIYSDVTERERSFRNAVILETVLTVITVGAGYAGLMLVIILGARDLERAHQKAIKMASQMASLSAAADAKTRLLTSVSHHLKTPLNAIIGFSEMIEAEKLGPIGDKRYARFAADILDAGRKLLKGIDNILDYIRVDGGRLALHPDLQSPQQILRTVALEAADAASLAGITIEVEEVPVDFAYLKADAKYLRQVLRNLTDNAIRYNKPGGHVWLGGRLADEMRAVFTVRDDGPGVAAEDLPGIFVPFGQRQQILTQFQDGFGIGLPLSRRIAERLGGSLTLERLPQGGMLATLVLPRDPEEMEAAT